MRLRRCSVNDRRMASAPPVIAPVRSAAIVAALAALVAAALILFFAGDFMVAIGFLAAGLIAGGVVLAWRKSFSRTAAIAALRATVLALALPGGIERLESAAPEAH